MKLRMLQPSTGIGLLVLGSLALAWGQNGYPPGYLSPAPNMLSIVPPAPAPGDPRDAADRQIFRATRSLKDSPRWGVAQRDNDLSAAGVLQAFTCAAGMAFTAEKAPRLNELLGRVSSDAHGAEVSVKDRYHRKRPFLIDDGPICIDRSASLIGSFDYPSGHSTFGWAAGLILAELLPDRGEAILARARAYGESRVVCGVHNSSSVETGRTLAAALVAELHAAPQFRKDLELARAELAKLRAPAPPNAETCAAEAKALASSPLAATH